MPWPAGRLLILVKRKALEKRHFGVIHTMVVPPAIMTETDSGNLRYRKEETHMEKWRELGEELDRLLKLRTPPLGVKLLARAEDAPEAQVQRAFHVLFVRQRA